MPQPATFDERFIEAFENVAEMRSDIRHMDADVSALKTDVSELKTDMSGLRVDMADFKGEIRADMAEFKGELHAHVNRQAWMTISVLATLMVASVGLTGYFVKILA